MINNLTFWKNKDKNLDLLLSKFQSEHPNKKLIFLFQAGSHFFDLNSKKSDSDYRGIYIDEIEDSFQYKKRMENPKKYPNLKRTNIHVLDYKTKEQDNRKNTNQDTDLNLFSLSSFILLLKSGDFNSMEMLFTPESKIIFMTPLFYELMQNKKDYLVNDPSSFLGFIKKEYKRYGININHYGIQKRFVEFLSQFPEHDRLADHWSMVKDYAQKTQEIKITESRVDNSKTSKNLPTIEIIKSLYSNTSSIKYIKESLEDILKSYGHRQKNMEKTGLEFKGLYHTMRLIYEAEDLIANGEFKFPFSFTRHFILKSIKSACSLNCSK